MTRSSHQLELRELQLENLRPNPTNPRTHGPQQIERICASIRQIGFRSPLIVDEDGMIIAGHGRFEAARKLGLATVPCIVVKGLTQAQKYALAIADNRIPQDAGWDRDRLAEMLAAMQDEDTILATGLSDDEIADLLGKQNEHEEPEILDASDISLQCLITIRCTIEAQPDVLAALAGLHGRDDVEIEIVVS